MPLHCRMHKAEVYRLGIDLAVCDEAHMLKNSDAQITQAVAGLPTKRRLLVSGWCSAAVLAHPIEPSYCLSWTADQSTP